MIVRPRLSWLRLLFVLRGSVLPVIWPQLAGPTAFARHQLRALTRRPT